MLWFFVQESLDFSGMIVVWCLTTELQFMQFIIGFIKRGLDIDKVRDKNMLIKAYNLTPECRLTFGNKEWVCLTLESHIDCFFIKEKILLKYNDQRPHVYKAFGSEDQAQIFKLV